MEIFKNRMSLILTKSNKEKINKSKKILLIKDTVFQNIIIYTQNVKINIFLDYKNKAVKYNVFNIFKKNM